MLGSKSAFLITGFFCLHMQTTEKKEGTGEVRQLSVSKWRTQAWSPELKKTKLLSFPCPCFLSHKRFLHIRARGCRIMSLVSCIWGSLQTGHDGVLPLRMVRNRLSGNTGASYCTKLQETPGAGQPFNVLRQRVFKEGKVGVQRVE